MRRAFMKLLVVSTWFPSPPDNGSKLRAFHLLRELARHHDISLLSFCGTGQPAADRISLLREFCVSVEVVPRGPFHTGALTLHGVLSTTPRAYVQGFVPEMLARARASVSGHDAAIALAVTAALYLRDINTLPLVFEEAEVAVVRDAYTSEDRRAQRLRRGLTWWKYSRFIRNLCGRFGRTTVVSEAERALLEQVGCDPRRIAVVPNGVDASDLAWSARPVRNRLIYPGSMTYAANLDAVRWFLGAILPIIDRGRPPVEFWVTGSTDGVAVSALPNTDRLTLTGHLPDVRPAVAESTICVVPLRIGGGTRLKILQAMALGTPVVATSKGAEGLEVTPGRDILLGDTPEAFAAHVCRLLSDDTMRERISAEARALVRDRYTWARSAARLNEVVSDAVSTWRAVRT
jgi:glycosyltransferase involved in cell wall biosynthesis